MVESLAVLDRISESLVEEPPVVTSAMDEWYQIDAPLQSECFGGCKRNRLSKSERNLGSVNGRAQRKALANFQYTQATEFKPGQIWEGQLGFGKDAESIEALILGLDFREEPNANSKWRFGVKAEIIFRNGQSTGAFYQPDQLRGGGALAFMRLQKCMGRVE